MNQRQRAFCEEYLRCGNAAEAARAAGYSARTARSQGQRLLTNDDISEYLQRRREELDAERSRIDEEMISLCMTVAKDESAKTRDRLKAAELLMKSRGMFIEKLIIRKHDEQTEDKELVIYIPDNGRDK